MVLCRFFLQGSCRFGTKCNNEHLDIKQLVKTDLEAAINGKQWPISCFGPFKDKPSVPNFIEDQSFEEIRWSCYEAKQKNCVDQYVQQFNKEVMEANNKMKTMLQLSPAVMDIICRLYDTPVDGTNLALTKNNVNNPFGMGGNVINDKTTSIFNKANNNTFGSGFGNSASTNNAGNVFGGSTTTPAAGIFGGGGSFASQTQQTSLFSQQPQKPSSVFGGGGAQNNLFCQAATNTTTVMGGIFGQSGQTSNLFAQNIHQQQQTQPTASGGLFGQRAQQTQMNPEGGLFAQQGQVQTSAGANLFTQNLQQQQQTNSGNIFAQALQSQQPQQNSGFSSFQMNKPQTNSVFGQQQSAFGQQNANMFGTMNANTSGNNTNNLFAQALNTTDSSDTFKTTNSETFTGHQNIFAQAVQQQKQQQIPTNLFSQPTQPSVGMQPSTAFFQQNIQSQQIPNQQNLFSQPVAGNNAGLLQSPVVSSSVYSKLEDLSPEDIESFKADTFTPGRIPNVPPPRELIN